MANYIVPEEKLINIANSIRSKTGKQLGINIDNMPVEIENISGGSDDTIIQVLNKGIVSTKNPGVYKTAFFTQDISDLDYIYIRIYANIKGTDYVGYYSIKVSDISDTGLRVYIYLHQNIRFLIKTDSICCEQYSGDWEDIYTDIWGIKIGGGGGEEIKLTQFDSLKFSAISSIILGKGLNSDYSYYVEFSYIQGEDNVTYGPQSMFGLDNTTSYRNFLSIGMESARYTFGGSTAYTVGWDQIWGRHHIFFNPADSKVYFDDVDTNQTYSKATYDFGTYPLKVGNINTETFPGRIHRITIKNGDDLVADYVPAGYVIGSEVVISGLLDLVTNKLFCQPLLQAYN